MSELGEKLLALMREEQDAPFNYILKEAYAQGEEITRLRAQLARAWTIANERGKVIDRLQKELDGLYVGAGCNRRPRGKDDDN